MKRYLTIFVIVIILAFLFYKWYDGKIEYYNSLKKVNYRLQENELNKALQAYFLTFNSYPDNYMKLLSYMESLGGEYVVSLDSVFVTQKIKIITNDSSVIVFYPLTSNSRELGEILEFQKLKISDMFFSERNLILASSTKLDLCPDVMPIFVKDNTVLKGHFHQELSNSFIQLLNNKLSDFFVGKEKFMEEKRFESENKKKVFVHIDNSGNDFQTEIICDDIILRNYDKEGLIEVIKGGLNETSKFDSIQTIYFPVEVFESILPIAKTD